MSKAGVNASALEPTPAHTVPVPFIRATGLTQETSQPYACTVTI